MCSPRSSRRYLKSSHPTPPSVSIFLGRDEAAGELWEKALILRPNYPEANFMLGELPAKRRDYTAATITKRLGTKTLRSPFITSGSVAFICFLGNFNQALEIFQSAAKRFPQQFSLSRWLVFYSDRASIATTF